MRPAAGHPDDHRLRGREMQRMHPGLIPARCLWLPLRFVDGRPVTEWTWERELSHFDR